MKAPKKVIKLWCLLSLFGAFFLGGSIQVADAAVSTGQFMITERENKPGGSAELPTGKLPEKETVIVQQRQSTKAHRPGQSKQLNKVLEGLLPQTSEIVGRLTLILGGISAGIILAFWYRQRRPGAHANKQVK